MNALKLFVAIVISLSACSATGRNWPSAKLTIVVVDEEGRPLPGIDVAASLFADEPGSRGVTDEDGRFTVEGRTGGVADGSASKKGEYYPTTFQFNLPVPDGVQVTRRYPPHTYRLTLRRIGKPVPMYAYHFMRHLKQEQEGQEFGIDLLKADLVQPLGKGEVADMLVTISGFGKVGDYFRPRVLRWRFPRPGDGMVSVPREDIALQSNGSDHIQESLLQMPRMAPEEGYEPEWYDVVNEQNREIPMEPAGRRLNGAGYFIRIRSEVDEHGKIIRAMYGKIYRPRPEAPVRWVANGFRSGPEIQFTYYVNPDSTRNMEFDPEKNLFRGVLSIQEERNFPKLP